MHSLIHLDRFALALRALIRCPPPGFGLLIHPTDQPPRLPRHRSFTPARFATVDEFMDERFENCRPRIDVNVVAALKPVEVPLRIAQAALEDTASRQFILKIVEQRAVCDVHRSTGM